MLYLLLELTAGGSFKGVTGANRLEVEAVAKKLEEIRKYTDLPIGVGFGIRDAESASQVAGNYASTSTDRENNVNFLGGAISG